MLGLSGIPPVAQMIGLMMLPESPRWLIRNNFDEKAKEVLKRIYYKEEYPGL